MSHKNLTMLDLDKRGSFLRPDIDSNARLIGDSSENLLFHGRDSFQRPGFFWGELGPIIGQAPDVGELDVWIPAAEIAGITFRPSVLGQELPGFPTSLPPAGLLPGTHSMIGPKVPPTEVTSFEHWGPPAQRRWRPLYRVMCRKEKNSKSSPPGKKSFPLQLHQCQIRLPFCCRLHPDGSSRSHIFDSYRTSYRAHRGSGLFPALSLSGTVPEPIEYNPCETPESWPNLLTKEVRLSRQPKYPSFFG